jgi:ribonuclease J
MGIPAKNVFVMQNGDALVIEPDGKARLGDRVQSGAILVDGMMLGEFEGSLLRDRKELSESGLITISVVLDGELRLAAPIQTDSKGCIYGLDRDNIRPDVELSVERAVDSARSGAVDRGALSTEIRKRIREVLGRNFRTYPSIMPLITILGEHRQPGGAAPARAAQKGRRGRSKGPKKVPSQAAKTEVTE